MHVKDKLLMFLFANVLWVLIALVLVVNFFVGTSAPIPSPKGEKTIDILTMSVWGSPGSFGVKDKDERISAIGDFINNSKEIDIFLLEELWMRPDHERIREKIPKGMRRTQTISVNNFYNTKRSLFQTS